MMRILVKFENNAWLPKPMKDPHSEGSTSKRTTYALRGAHYENILCKSLMEDSVGTVTTLCTNRRDVTSIVEGG